MKIRIVLFVLILSALLTGCSERILQPTQNVYVTGTVATTRDAPSINGN